MLNYLQTFSESKKSKRKPNAFVTKQLFFLARFFFHKHSPFTGQQKKKGSYFFPETFGIQMQVPAFKIAQCKQPGFLK